MALDGGKLTVSEIQLKRGLAAAWAEKNPVLKEGEVGLELDTKKYKVGDGTSTWSDLEYWGGGELGEITSIDGGLVLAP